MNVAEPHSGERPRREYSFAGFILDLDGGFLRRAGQEIALRPKSFEVLAYLVERQGRLVSREELMRAVWPDVTVADESVTKCIADIRKALEEDSQQLIRTVARRGYMFAAPVTTPVLEFPRAQELQQVGPAISPPANPPLPQRRLLILAGAAVLLAVAAAALLAMWRIRPREREVAYTQLTNFTDSAISPALSPDGKMLAFIRSDNWFLTPDQIYAKMLPNGEPVQITHDPRPKYGPAFSPDGTRIVYTVADRGWRAVTVSALGGEPSELLNNASGVSWLDPRRILFSEVNPPAGVHMGMVTAMPDRSEQRTVYFPQEERGMVHLSYASPDRKWALAVEMNPIWQPCRVVPLDGSSSGRQVGPKGNCTSAAWSPDGRWMYFGVQVDGSQHLWRQRFPEGQPERITSGPTEEEGVAVAPDGRSLVTSVGARQGALWIHDALGDRPLSSQGYVAHPDQTHRTGSLPKFSRDGKSLFYLRSESPGTGTELWRADLASEKSGKLLPGITMLEYDISDDAKDVAYSVEPAGKPSQIWLASLDRSSPARMISTSGADSPYFGPDGQIAYRTFDGTNHYLERVNRDGSSLTRVPHPIGNIFSISPDRHWIMTAGTIPNGIAGTYAVPIDGGSPRRVCSGCPVLWAPNGQFLYVSLPGPRKTRIFPLPPGEILPKLPPMGQAEAPELFPGYRVIDGYAISPGPHPSVYAYVKTTMHRNLFRIPLRD